MSRNGNLLSPRVSRGFSLAELLLVIAMIAILMVILLPAVQRTREAARRTQCRNHLMQLGIALHNYNMAFERFPPGVSNPTRPVLNVPDSYHMGWITQILPYMEQQNAYQRIDFQQSVYAPANQTVHRHSIPILTCPSDPANSWNTLPDGSQIRLSSYAGVHNDLEAPIDVDQNGVLFLNSNIRYEDITDSSSNTLLVGEIRLEPGLWGWMSGTRSTLRNLVSLSTTVGNPANRPANQADSPYITHGTWETPPIDQETGLPDARYVGGFDSHHPGIVGFLFADGSVRALVQGADPTVMRRLADRHDDELIGNF